MKILHLYYDLMNLYGEYANVSALERYLSQQGIDVVADKKSLYDEIDFSQYGLIYIGSGTEQNQLVALRNLMQRKDAVKRAYENGAVILATGNAFELFGSKIVLPDSQELEALGFFGYYTVLSGTERTLTDQVCTDRSGSKAVGFINKSSEIFGADKPMFTVDFGAGNNKNEKTEGFTEGNFFGTHLIGPCLVKNPLLAEFFVKMLCDKENAEFKKLQCEYEQKAYEITLRELLNRFVK